jgi:ribosomal protein L37AE/L43A
MYLPMDCPICGRRRLELIDGTIVRCEKCTTSSEWDGFRLARYAEVSDEIRKRAAAQRDEETP